MLEIPVFLTSTAVCLQTMKGMLEPGTLLIALVGARGYGCMQSAVQFNQECPEY